MSGNYVENVSGRGAAAKEIGSPQQKSWSILLERKIKKALDEHMTIVPVLKVQQPLNGQWLIVVNGTIVVHRPGKTVTSIYRADEQVTPETIGAACFTNLIAADKPSARVKNETQLFAMLLAEVDRDLGVRVEEPAMADPAKAEPETVSQVGKQGPRSRIQRRGKSSNEFARLPAVAAESEEETEDTMPKFPKRQDEETEEVVEPNEPKLRAGQKPDPVPFQPLLGFVENVKQFVALDAMLVEAIDRQGQYVTWAVNVYVPVHALVDGELEIVEQLHLLTLIDEHSRGCSENDLADSTLAPMVIRLDADEFTGNTVQQTMENFFEKHRLDSQLMTSNGEIAFLQDEIGLPDTSVNVFSYMASKLQRESVRVEQTCKHPSLAVRNALSRFALKTVYFGKVVPE